MLPVMKSKSEAMTAEDWKWLNALPFGLVIFASPKPGTKYLPEMIGTGDWDGDLYVVCWNKDFLVSVKTRPLNDIGSSTVNQF